MTLPFQLFILLVRLIPIPLGRQAARWIGRFAFLAIPSLRRRSLESLQVAYGNDLRDEEIRRIGRESLAELAMTLFEFLKMPWMSDEQALSLLPLEGEEHLEPLRGKPAIYISGHLGNVILLGVAMTLRGHRVCTVVRPFTSSNLREIVARVSNRFGLGAIERRGARVGVQSLDVLRRGDVLGLVVDQDAGKPGIFVDFFGKPASTFLGTVQLSRKQQVPVVPMFCVRAPNGHLRAVVEPPMNLRRTGDRATDDRLDTQAHAALLESWVRRYPASYLWLHRRWKTRPEPTESPASSDPPREAAQ